MENSASLEANPANETESDLETSKSPSVPKEDKTTDSKCYSYEGETYVYTDSATGFQYKWDTTENKWVPKVSQISEAPNPSSGTNYEIVDGTYVYKDEKTGAMLMWDAEAKEWKAKEAKHKPAIRKHRRGSDEEVNTSEESEDEEALEKQRQNINYNVQVDSDGVRTYTDPSDGTVYEWDDEKKAWFPRLDDEFLARYQLSYGVDQSNEAQQVVEEPKPVAAEQKSTNKTPKEPNWFEVDDAHNTKVYVSGLPTDITEQEFLDFMQKCGLVEKDLQTNKMKIKLYKTEDGQMKGDALCTYIKIESVDLALKLLDGSRLRDQTVRVERAKFTLKGQYDPTKKPRKRKKKELEKMKKKQQMLFDWRPDQLRGERPKNESVVVLKRLFKPVEFDSNPALLLEYQRDLRDECTKFGSVKKVIIFDRNEEGAAQIFFRSPEEADACIEKLHGRWFAGQKITAETWDGVTKYRKDETEEEKKERLAKWAQFLQEEENQGKSEES